MKQLYLLFLSILACCNCDAQTIFFQDVFKGGVCVTGTASANTGNPFVDVPYYMEPGSSIRKIFMITYEHVLANDIEAYDYDFIINGVPVNQNNTDNTTVFSPNLIDPFNVKGIRNHIVDVSNQITLSGGMIHIEVPYHETPLGCPGCYYSAPVFVILYENNLLPTTNVALLINDVVNAANTNISPITGFNPANYSQDIAMGVHSDRIGGHSLDGFEYFINNQYIGYNDTLDDIPGPDLESGVIGTYYYQNGNLTGLTDDVANTVLSGSDGILNINSYIGSSLNPLDIDFNYLTPPGVSLNNILVGLYFAYSTPCIPFNASVSNDTTLCKGASTQFIATGGQSYQWEPATGLSCSNCPNPIVTADTTRLYKVQIFNNDSCSVILPVMVHVRENPIINSLQLQATTCGDSTGKIKVTDPIGMTYSMDAGIFQALTTFSLVPEGAHVITVMDNFGCTSDTTVTIGYVNNVNAAFSVNPNSGVAPLNASITNQSSGANSFEWSINGQPYIGQLTNYVFDPSGSYTIQLIATNNYAYCADTVSMVVDVYDSLIISLPNVFTPNNDGVNDYFSLTANQDVEFALEILNRWGEEVFHENGKLFADIPKTCWSGNQITEGVYFIKLEVTQANGVKNTFQNFLTIKK